MAQATGIGRRQRRALETRRRILDAARTQFLAVGYQATTMEHVADLADVAPQTIYTVFGNKRSLLKTLVDEAVAGDDEAIPTLERPWVAAAIAAPSPSDHLEIHTHHTREALERVAPILRVARQAADSDVEMADLWQTACNQRRTVQAHLVTALLAKPGTRNDLDLHETVDLVYFALGPESYWTLVDEQNWPPHRWQQRMHDLLAAYILTRPPHS